MTPSRRLAVVLLVGLVAGCGQEPDDTYGTLRGASLNGASAFVQLLRDAGHRTATRRALAERMIGRHDVAIVFNSAFDAPDEEARKLLGRFLAAEGDQTLVFVVRDSDAAIAYWQAVAETPGLPAAKAERARFKLESAAAELERDTREAFPAAPSDRSPFAYGLVVRDRPVPAPIDVAVAGETAPIRAQWPLRRRLEPPRGMRTVWSHAGEPLLVASRGSDRTLLLASAAPLLNGGLVDPGNRRLAAALVAQLPEEARVVVVGSARMRQEEGDERPSAWRLLTVQPNPWIFAQAVVAMALFCWWKAPIFGRPKREEARPPQDFGHHVEALGALLRKSRDEDFARGRLEAWRRSAAGLPGPAHVPDTRPLETPRRQA